MSTDGFDGRPVRAAIVGEDHFGDYLQLQVGYRAGEGVNAAVTSFGVDGIQTELVDRHASMPKILLSREVAKALFDALSEHFHGASDVRQLREDYKAERARVDKLINFAITPPTVEYRETLR